MKVIILGATGMIGSGVLLECLDDNRIEAVLIINRQPSGVTNSKLKEIIHKDFYDLSPVKEELKGYDACFFCLGVTSVGLNEEQYHKVTYELTVHFARLLLSVNPNLVFCYISGKGTDSTEKGSTMWARVKGKTENTLLQLPFRDVYMFRPGFIQPMRGIRSKTGWYNAVYAIFKPFYFILKNIKSYVTDTSSLGKAMIRVGLQGYDKKIIESSDIYTLSH